jgi:iron(III) transport system permease protein
VTLPRCRGAIAAAALWIGVLTAADISVSDVLLVPTFAEEIHTEFTLGGPDALARALLLALPAVALTWLFLFAFIPPLERSLPPLSLDLTAPRLFDLGKLRWFWLGGCSAGMVAAFLLLPLLSLAWKVGLAGTPRRWSAALAWQYFSGEFQLSGLQVFATLAVALLTGVLAATMALVVCWAASGHRPLRLVVLALVTLAWAMPAPVVGIGLKETILSLVRWCPIEPLPSLLYYGPSFAPVVWAHLVRFFPFAVAILWPAVRLVPIELRDAARLDGAGPLGELWHVYRPMTRRACVLAIWTVAALSMGEVGASSRVETPGWETFAKLLFDRMHYGVEASVAALALVLLAEIGALFGVFWVARAIYLKLSSN